ncbi:MAG: DUF6607 family protein, partial [Planctomycetota bacterium]
PTSDFGDTYEQDRQSILAMAGEFKVSFQFKETISFVDGYELKDPYIAQATEFVDVIEDKPGFIDLQHILVMGTGENARVIKHWRQSWEYEPARVLDFKGERSWKMRDVSEADREGKWGQTVWQVDDSPRYGGLGAWNHDANTSSWTSEEVWRPLPRREHSKRSDYQVMGCVNRHTLTPTGWVHEQDNTKIVLTEDGKVEKIIAREVGLNVYDREGEGIARGLDLDMSAGKEYWARTAPFWADVRAAMQAELADGEMSLVASVDEKPLYAHMFGYAANMEGEYDQAAAQQFIRETMAKFAVDADEAVATR